MNDKMKEQLEFIEKMRNGFGVVRTEEQIETDLDKEFQERMKREEEQREQERLMKERLEREQEEQRQRNYQAHKEIFDFMKVFNELEVEDYYAILELNNGKQFLCKPTNLKRDEEYIMIYIMKQKRGQLSWGENPLYCELEVNVNEVKGLKLCEEEKREIVLIKKSRFGKFEE